MRQHLGASVLRFRLMLSRLARVVLAVGSIAATVARAQAQGRGCTIHVSRTSAAAGAVGTAPRGGAVVWGMVTDASGKPLDATITIFLLGLGANTDASGTGSFAVPPSRLPSELTIAVRRTGYQPVQTRVRIAPGDTITVTASLCSARPVAVRRPVGSPGSPCLGPDEISDGALSRLRRLVRSSDSDEVAFRGLVHIPVVADSMIGLVTDGRICKGAVRAWAAADSTLGAPPPYVTDLYVIRIGPVFVATVPPTRALGDRQFISYRQYVVYNAQFEKLAPFLW